VHLPELLQTIPGVECVETRVPTLNDVFIKLTGRDIRDEDGEDSGGWFTAVARHTQKGN
jgi:ABC-2 type transport system ATP-binding protein